MMEYEQNIGKSDADADATDANVSEPASPVLAATVLAATAVFAMGVGVLLGGSRGTKKA